MTPNYQIKHKGENAIFDCTASAPTYISMWLYFSDEDSTASILPNNAITFSIAGDNESLIHRLRITNVTMGNQGEYICVLDNYLYEQTGYLHIIPSK